MAWGHLGAEVPACTERRAVRKAGACHDLAYNDWLLVVCSVARVAVRHVGCLEMAIKVRRKNIRLERSRYIGQSTYFVTFCCAARRRVFANHRAAGWLVEQFRRRSVEHRFAVYAYCVMPDHFHALVTGLDSRSSLVAFIGDFKQRTSHVYESRTGRMLWQRKFYDRILRSGERADSVAGYIWMNPVRQRLCVAPQEYPFSGSFVIDWKKGLAPVESWVPEWKSGRAGLR
jgi:putative transposase